MRSSLILSIATAIGLSSAAAVQPRDPKSCEGDIGAYAYVNQPWPPTGSIAHFQGCRLLYCDGNVGGALIEKVVCYNGRNACQLTPSGQGVCAP